MVSAIVHEVRGKWYFWDEDWAEAIGPFITIKEAEDALEKYMRDNELIKEDWEIPLESDGLMER